MWRSRVLAFLRRLLARRRAERDLDDEVRSYAALLADEIEAQGASPEEAGRRARLALGGVEPIKESVRDVRTGAAFEQTWLDVRYALRGLRRSPGFAATAVLTIGLGVGVNTTIFCVIDSTLFKPVPYERPEELVWLGRARSGLTVPVRMDWADVAAWRAERDIFQGVEVSSGGRARHWRERDESVVVGAFTPGLPALLGVAPALGRLFTPAEVHGKAPVIVIADALWARAFDRRPDVVGDTMTIDSRPLTIVGVMPPHFRYGPGGGGVLMAWIGMPERPDPDVPLSDAVSPTLRVRSGLSLETAQERAAIAAARMQQGRPENARWTPLFRPLVEIRRTGLREGVESSMLMLLATAGLVLLVACVNVANLLLTRGAGRRPELAMRTALGATRTRLARLLLAEGVALAVLGGAAAILIAYWATGVVVSLIPPETRTGMFFVSAPAIDWRVLRFALAATTVVALLAAMWPAISGSRIALRASVGSRGQVAGATPVRRRSSRVLQAVQIALAFLLATTAGLFATSFATMLHADLGFDPDGLAEVRFALPERRYPTRDAQYAAIADLLARVRATPGVRQAAVGSSPASRMPGEMIRAGQREPVATLAMRNVGPEFFETAGITLIAGRDFGPEDRRGAPRVAIIDEAGARRVFGRESPLGQRVRHHQAIPEATIVGVVATVAAFDFAQRTDTVGVYFPEAQDYPLSVFVVRGSRDLAVTLRNVRAALEAYDPGIRIISAGAATDYYDQTETFSKPRFYVVLVSVFAVLALLTMAVGLYGLLAHSVGQRRREIGVRVALGSTPGQVRSLVIREALGPIAAGFAAGGAAAWWAAGLLGSLLYGIGPRDPRAFAIAAVLLILAALLAALAPIRRATGVDPIVALRTE